MSIGAHVSDQVDGSEYIISACAATFACEVCALGVRRLFIQMESHLEEEVTSYEKQACMNDGSNLVLACNIRRLSVLWEAPFRAWQIGVKDAPWNHHETTHETTRVLPHC